MTNEQNAKPESVPAETTEPTIGDTVDQWLAIRKEAGKRIDPSTAECFKDYVHVGDPYGVCNLPPEYDHVGSALFVCDPKERIWVTLDDLPDQTREEVWRRIGAGDFNHPMPEVDEGIGFDLEALTISPNPGKAPVSLYRVVTTARDTLGYTTIKFHWVRCGKCQTRNYEKLCENYAADTQEAPYARHEIDELFTVVEAVQLKDYLDRLHHGISTTVIEAAVLPLPYLTSSPWVCGTGGDIGAYTLDKEPRYALPFVVLGLYDRGECGPLIAAGEASFDLMLDVRPIGPPGRLPLVGWIRPAELFRSVTLVTGYDSSVHHR